ncbi:hypothetical protein, partial [Streptomyces sp. NPDC000851]
MAAGLNCRQTTDFSGCEVHEVGRVHRVTVVGVQEGLAGVHREIGLGHPVAPGGPVGVGVGEVFLGRGEG